MRRAAPVIHRGRDDDRGYDHADSLGAAPPLEPETSGTWDNAPGGPAALQDAWGSSR